MMRAALFFRFAVVPLALALTGCEVSTGPGEDPPEQLVFVSDRVGVVNQWEQPLFDIFQMAADGSGLLNVTQHPARYYRGLSVTRDGRTLAVYSDRSGCYDVWTVQVADGAATQLTGTDPEVNHRCNYHPRWSPDGQYVAFTSTRGSEQPAWKLYVMRADGTSQVKVSGSVGEAEGGYIMSTGWSPDGRVVFEHASSERARSYIVRGDGTGLRLLLEDERGHSAAWSPDGGQIAYISDRDGQPNLYVVNADGTDVRRLTTHAGGEWHGDWLSSRYSGAFGNEWSPWSPDGTRIAFQNDDLEGRAIFTVRPDGSELRQITDRSLNATFNGWSPSGTRIAFTGRSAEAADVYVIDADGTGMVNVTSSLSHDRDALWLPR